MATTVVPWVISGTIASLIARWATIGASGDVRASRSANDDPGSDPGVKNGSDDSFMSGQTLSGCPQAPRRASARSTTASWSSSWRARYDIAVRKPVTVFCELPQASVASEAEQPTHSASLVVVVDVER